MPIVFGSILLILGTFLTSFLEAGALFWAARGEERHGEPKSERNEKENRDIASIGVVVTTMIVARTQIVIALSVWIVESFYTDKTINPGLVSTVVTGAVVLTEVIGKLAAIRFPEHARRGARPLRRLLNRVKPLWFRYG